MAGADLNVSRRALLGAACVAPVLGVVPIPLAAAGVPSLPTEGAERRRQRWAAALARFRGAEAAVAAGRSASEACFDRLADRFSVAMRRLLRTPAPDVAALATKLELAIDEEVFTLSGGEAFLAALRRDARRLAAAA